MERITNIYKAKRLVKDLLDEHDIEHVRLTARTVSFADLARDTAIFVKVHGLEIPDPRLLLVKAKLKGTGVLLDTLGVT